MEISSPPPLPPKSLPRSTTTNGPISLISINTESMHGNDAESNGSISLPHQITTKPSSTTTTLTQVVQVSSTSSESPSPTLPQTNGNIKTTSQTNAAGATVFIESKRPLLSTTNIRAESTIDQQLPNNNNNSNNHVVKILINPTKNNNNNNNLINNKNNKSIITLTKDQEINESNNNYELNFNNSVLINVNNNNIETINEEMIKNSTMKSTDLTTFQNKSTTNSTNQQSTTPVNGINNNPYFFYTGFQCSPTNLIMSSGQCSPSDTLDSGTCSDLDMTPPPLPKKKNSKTNLNSTSTVSITAINGKKNGDSSAEECEDSESNVSCDSLNDGSSDLLIMESTPAKSTSILPRNLLQDIREHRNNVKNTSTTDNVETKIIPQPPVVASVLEKTTTPAKVLINESTYEDRKKEKQDSGKNNNIISGNYLYETDRFYKFHLNENVFSDNVSSASSSLVSSPTDTIDDENECFAGYKDLLGGEVASTIRSAKGTVRGVKNRVRAGIATFLQIQQTTTKSYREKDAGKVVVYSTTMGIVRNTYHECLKVKQILRTHMVKFEERDVFMSSEYQAEIRDRMQSEQILIPQVFVDGQHIGDAETIDRLNESGELRRILKPYKSADACSTCQVCGGYRLLPCPVCNGSKKSVHRNHFTTEFVALKCMNCDEVGLVRCYNC